MESVPDSEAVIRPPNGPHAKLRGQGPRAEAGAARRSPHLTMTRLRAT
jgi:hypothetical protein